MADNNKVIRVAMISIIGVIILVVLGLFFLKPLLIKKELPKPVRINTTNQPLLGNPTAKIKMIAFEDLKCMNCARFNREIMPYIEKHYIKTNIANYTLINVAFIDGSLPAANAARCVYAQNKDLFFPYVEYIFQHQPPETQNWATVPTLLNFANEIKGIDTDQLAQCIIKSPYDQLIHDNLAQAMKIMSGGVSTPSLYINGILVTPTTKEQIDKVIEAVK